MYVVEPQTVRLGRSQPSLNKVTLVTRRVTCTRHSRPDAAGSSCLHLNFVYNKDELSILRHEVSNSEKHQENHRSSCDL